MQTTAFCAAFFLCLPCAAATDLYINAQTFGLTAGGTTALGPANKIALQKVIDSLGTTGGTVAIPCGFYYVDPGIALTTKNTHVTVKGCANGWSYEPKTLIFTPNFNPSSYEGGTVIRWSAAGAIGFDLSQINTTNPNGNRVTLSDMVIAGTPGAAVQTCIKASGMVHLLNLDVEGCTNKGIWLYQFINSALIDRVSALNNTGGTGYGLFVGSGGVTFRDNTVFRITNSTFRQNTVGMRIEQGNTYKVDNTVIESNAAEGLILFKQATPGPSVDGGPNVTKQHSQNSHGNFDNVWFENNGASSNNVNNVRIYSATPKSYAAVDVPNNITFKNARFTSSKGGAGGWKPNISIENGIRIRFENSVISTPDPFADGLLRSPVALDSYSQYVSFHSTLNNGLSNAVISDKGSMNVPYDWDEYDSFVVTLTGCTTAKTGTAHYVRAGRRITIDWPALSCTTAGPGTHTLTGMPGALAAASPKQFVMTATNGTVSSFGSAVLKGGALTLYPNASGVAWTAGGVFALPPMQTTYTQLR